MHKRDFIQNVIIRSLPKLEKLAASVRYADGLWDGLTKLGYGAQQQAKPRETKDWYKAMSDYQREWFDLFWHAYNYRKGRDGAAMRWHQLGEPGKAEYQKIIDAAKAEARRPLEPGVTRKMAQGWLHERRWEDFQQVQDPDKGKRDMAARIQELIGEQRAIQVLQKAKPDAAHSRSLAKIAVELQQLKTGGADGD